MCAERTQPCPVCETPTWYSERFSEHVCNDCMENIYDEKGRKIVFYNENHMGHGCQGWYADKDVVLDDDQAKMGCCGRGAGRGGGAMAGLKRSPGGLLEYPHLYGFVKGKRVRAEEGFWGGRGIVVHADIGNW